MTQRLALRIIVSVLSLCLLFVLGSVSPTLLKEDKIYIDRFISDWNLKGTISQIHKDFDHELAFISSVQDSVVGQIRHEEIPHNQFGSMAFYYSNRKGFCYDRAVMMEKIFENYGFTVRHAYVYFGKNGEPASWKDLFSKNLSSHALMEVKTSRGWMAIGSNGNWLGYTKDGRVLDIVGLRSALADQQFVPQKELSEGQAFYLENGYQFNIIYGLYSRHGGFFNKSNAGTSLVIGALPEITPDYNLRMLFYNF